MLRMYDVKAGVPRASLGHLDAPAALARKRDVERRLGELRGDAARAGEREALKAENAAIDARLRELREAEHRETQRRMFAGIGTPFYEEAIARLDAALVAELERGAMVRFAAREQKAAERRAAKAAAKGEAEEQRPLAKAAAR